MGRSKGYIRDEVLRSAATLFCAKGYYGTSVQDLERATSVNKSGLYSEFHDKDDIYCSALEQAIFNDEQMDVLSASSLGWINIEHFLKIYEFKKKCFIASSLREITFLPIRAQKAILSHRQDIKKEVIKNLQYEKISEPADIAEIILAFNDGNYLLQNMDIENNREQYILLFLKSFKNPSLIIAQSVFW